MVDRNISYADETRTRLSSAVKVNANTEEPQLRLQGGYLFHRVKASVKVKVVCFHCGKTGHMRRDCFGYEEQCRKKVNTASTRT